MSENRYDIRWIGHYKDGVHNKIWGWFYYNDPTAANDELEIRKPGHRRLFTVTKNHVYSYTFWAGVGKKPFFKKHSNSQWRMKSLVDKKKTNSNYVEISLSELLKIYPNFFEKMDEKFLFHLLADNL